MKIPTSDKAFVELVDSLEKIERDLSTVDQLGDIVNIAVLSKLESKLPVKINQSWIQIVVFEKLSKKSSKEKFDRFMLFLREAKEMAKYRANKDICFVTGTSITPLPSTRDHNQNNQSKGLLLPCLACNGEEATENDVCIHNTGSCRIWGRLSYDQRVALVKCIRHPFSRDNHTTQECTRRITRPCVHCKKTNKHNFLLCPEFKIQKDGENLCATSDM